MREAGATGAATSIRLAAIRARPAARATVKCAPFEDRRRNRAHHMLEINPLLQTLKDIEARTDVLRGYL